MPHLAACLLARVDGKSPVDYLGEAAQRSFVRELALSWLHHGPCSFDEAFALMPPLLSGSSRMNA